MTTSVLILFILIYSHLDSETAKYNWFERQVSVISQSFLIKPIYVIGDFFNIFKFNFIADGTEIRDLKLNYERLKNDYKILEQENTHLSHILKYSPRIKNIIATARVFNSKNNLGSGIFMISAGENDRIQFGDIATSTQGLVGKVVKIHKDTSIILPIRHLSAKTIGRVQSQGSMVLVSGRYLKGGVIEYISDTIGLEKGQGIYTLSDGKSMPSGIKIGTIIDPYERPIRVKLSADFAKLDYVTIIREDKPAQIEPDLSSE